MNYRLGIAMSTEAPKRFLFSQLAVVAKALGHGLRLEMLELLAQGERNVEAIARLVGVPIANASQHLQLLRRAGVVAARRDGKRVLYRLADESVVAVVAGIRRVAERSVAEMHGAVSGYFRERDAMEAVSREELLRRLRRREVTVLDVRPLEEFAAGHLARAVSVPLAELGRRLRDLDRRREVVAYCRGPYCVLAYEAVAALRKRGFRARRLEDGFPEWKAAGLPIEVGATP